MRYETRVGQHLVPWSRDSQRASSDFQYTTLIRPLGLRSQLSFHINMHRGVNYQVPVRIASLEVFALLEEHGETDDCAIDKQSPNDTHGSRFLIDQRAMGKQDRKCCSKSAHVPRFRFSISRTKEGESAWTCNVPIPMTTRNPVRNLPKSTTPLPPDSIKSS